MFARDVRCNDCHDSHGLNLLKDGNALCLQCHQKEVYDGYDHHFHKQEHEGQPSDGALCVKCHMVEQPYMVIDWRADHSFRVPRPDLSAEIGTPNACTQSGCHDDRPLSWSLDAYREWYGRARKPHFGTAFAAARRGMPGAEDELSRIAASELQPAMVRATALELLARTPGEVSSAAIEAALMSDEPLLRRTAILNLAVADPAERAALLSPLLFDPLKAVRTAALSQIAGVPREMLKPYQQEAFDSVLKEFREAMAYSLDFASSGLNLGNLYANLGRIEEAERYYRLALKIDDLFLPAKMNLAVLLSRQGRNTEAEQLLREVLEAYPDNGDAAYSLGLLLVEMEKPEEAVAWLRRAAEADSRFSRVRYNLGLLLQQLGQLDEAERMLVDALGLEPENLEYLYALADHLVRRGRLQEALRLAERMILAHPDNRMGHELKQAIEGRM
jgi:predicted CXXCH cytochrome family protein